VSPELAPKAGIENKCGAYLVLADPLFNDTAGRQGFITDSLERAMRKADLKLLDLDTVIASHIGDLEATWIEDLARAGLRVGAYRNLRKKYGNTAVADVLIDLADFTGYGELAKDSIVALWTPCVGVQVAAIVLRWLV
jgi:3-oxoacyl-[acyl-carrier-protein] synthase III